MPSTTTPTKKQDDALPSIPNGGSNIEGIPIAAKFKGPGPVYSLPPTLGTDAKFVGKRAPAYSFGVKIPPKTNSIGPGPAAFAPVKSGEGPSFSLQGGFKKARRNGRAVIIGKYESDMATEVDLDNPGPANYNLMHLNNGNRPPAYTITGRQASDKQNPTPGPAAYRPPSCIGTHQTAVESSPAPTIMPLRPGKSEYRSPGPAAYQPVSPAKLRQAAPAYSLGRRWDENEQRTKSRAGPRKLTPGPGEYNPMYANKHSAPNYSFRQRHSEYEHFVPDEDGTGRTTMAYSTARTAPGAFFTRGKAMGTVAAASTLLFAGYSMYTAKATPLESAPQTLPPAGVKGTATERTFIAVKPDGVQRGLVGEVIRRFEDRGYKLVGLKLLVPSRQLAEKHYEDLKDKPFFSGLVNYMTNGKAPVVAMVWQGQDVIRQGRRMIGATNPLQAEPGTIRADYCITIGRNIIHGSDSYESAETEISLWFGKDVVNWTQAADEWITSNN
ncbi:nucleoside diphosphate kinase Ndk1 [Sorochytrium milnesiophthora]